MLRKVVTRGARKIGKFAGKKGKGLASGIGKKGKAGAGTARKTLFPSGKKSRSTKITQKAGKLAAKSIWTAGRWGFKGLWHLAKQFPHGTITAIVLFLLIILGIALFIILAAYGTFSPGELAANRSDEIPGGPWTAHTSDVPEQYKQWYIDAAIEHTVPWQILVGWGDVATNHGKRSPYDCIWRVDPDSPAAWSEDMETAFGDDTIVHEYIKNKNLKPPVDDDSDPESYPLNSIGWTPYSYQASCDSGGSASGWLYQWCPEISNLPDDAPDPPIAPNIIYNSPIPPYGKKEGRTIRHLEDFYPYLPVIGSSRFADKPGGIASECTTPTNNSSDTKVSWQPEGTTDKFTRSWRVKWTGNTRIYPCGPMLLTPRSTGISCRELQSAQKSINIVAETISAVLDGMNQNTKCQASRGSELCTLDGQIAAYDNSLMHPPPILSADNHIPELLRKSAAYYPGYWGKVVGEALLLLREGPGSGFHPMMMGKINCQRRGGQWGQEYIGSNQGNWTRGWETQADIYYEESRTGITEMDEFFASLICELDATGPGTYFDWRAGSLPNEGAASSKLASSLWAKDLMDASWGWSQWGTKNGKNGCVNAGKISDSSTLRYQYSGVYLPFPPLTANGSRPYSMCDMHFLYNRANGADQTNEWEGLQPIIDNLYDGCEKTGSHVYCTPLERYLISMFPFAFDREGVKSNGEVEGDNENKFPLASIPDYNPYRKFEDQDNDTYDHPWAGGKDGNEWLHKIIEWCGFADGDFVKDQLTNPGNNSKVSVFTEDSDGNNTRQIVRNTMACILYLSAIGIPDEDVKKTILSNANNLMNGETDHFGCWFGNHIGGDGDDDHNDQIECEAIKLVAANGEANKSGNAFFEYTSNNCSDREIKYPCAYDSTGESFTDFGDIESDPKTGGEMINAAWYVRALHAGVAPWPNASMFPDGNERWREALANIISSRDLDIFDRNYIGHEPEVHVPAELENIESLHQEMSDEINLKTSATYEAGAAVAAIQYLGWGGFGNAVKTTSQGNSAHKCLDDTIDKDNVFLHSKYEIKEVSEPIEEDDEDGDEVVVGETITKTITYQIQIREKVSTKNGVCIPKIAELGSSDEGFLTVENGVEFEEDWYSILGDWKNDGYQMEFTPDFKYTADDLPELARNINREFGNTDDKIDEDKIEESFWAMSSANLLSEHYDRNVDQPDLFSMPFVEIAYTPAYVYVEDEDEDEPPENKAESPDADCRFVLNVSNNDVDLSNIEQKPDISDYIEDLWWECIWKITESVDYAVMNAEETDTEDSEEEETDTEDSEEEETSTESDSPIFTVDTAPYVLLQIPYIGQKNEIRTSPCYVFGFEEGKKEGETKRCFTTVDETDDDEICGNRSSIDEYVKEFIIKLTPPSDGEDDEKVVVEDDDACDFSRLRNFQSLGNTDCGSAYRLGDGRNKGAANTLAVIDRGICKQIETVPWMARGWNRPSPWDRGSISGNGGYAGYHKSIFETATWPISSSKRVSGSTGSYICDPSSSSGSQYWRKVQRFGNPSPSIPSVNTISGYRAIQRICNANNPVTSNRPIIASIAYPGVSHISPHRWVGWSDQPFTEEKRYSCNLSGSLEYERKETCWHAGLEIAQRARWMAGGIQSEDGPPMILPHECHPSYQSRRDAGVFLTTVDAPGFCALGEGGMQIYPTQPWISDRHFCEGEQDGTNYDGIYLRATNAANYEGRAVKVKNKFVDCGYEGYKTEDDYQSIYSNYTDCADDDADMGYVPSGDICRRFLSMYDSAENYGITFSATSHVSPQGQLAKRFRNCTGTDDEKLYDKDIYCSASTSLPRSRYSWHEMGSAIDFTFPNKVTITKTSREFFWLFLHAYRFGLQNLSSEPWHWSPMGA